MKWLHQRLLLHLVCSFLCRPALSLIIPSLHSVRDDIRYGEKRVAEKLNQEFGNSDSGIVWYEPPIGPLDRMPDFVVMDRSRGLVVMEVKEWKTETILRCNPRFWTIQTANGDTQVKNPLLQARQYAEAIRNLLESDLSLVSPAEHPYAGRLSFPCGYGVVFTNLSRRQMVQLGIVQTMNEKLVFCRDDLNSDGVFPWRRCLQYDFGEGLTPYQVDKIRSHLFPEIVINHSINGPVKKLKQQSEVEGETVSIMDLKQEKVARSLGRGHRIVHGVSGSGKTLILQCRAQYLAKATDDPILVLCYNKLLANKIRNEINQRGSFRNVDVRTFHSWCHHMLVRHKVNPPTTRNPGEYATELVRLVRNAMDEGVIPKSQYHGVLVDEAHDFDPVWLRLIVDQVDTKTNSILLVYDDAQRLYSHHGKKFTWSSVGIDARGRATILRTNYRNTKEILDYAEPFLRQSDGDEVLSPRSAGRTGPSPRLIVCEDEDTQRKDVVRACLLLQNEGWELSDIAVLCRTKQSATKFAAAIYQAGTQARIVGGPESTSSPTPHSVSVITMHSSKGLEFPVVLIPEIDQMRVDDSRLLYVAMTRATSVLILLMGDNRSPIARELFVMAVSAQTSLQTFSVENSIGASPKPLPKFGEWV